MFSTANNSNMQFLPQLGLLGWTLKVNQLGNQLYDSPVCTTVETAQRLYEGQIQNTRAILPTDLFFPFLPHLHLGYGV